MDKNSDNLVDKNINKPVVEKDDTINQAENDINKNNSKNDIDLVDSENNVSNKENVDVANNDDISKKSDDTIENNDIEDNAKKEDIIENTVNDENNVANSEIPVDNENKAIDKDNIDRPKKTETIDKNIDTNDNKDNIDSTDDANIEPLNTNNSNDNLVANESLDEISKKVEEEIFTYEGANEYVEYLDTLEKEIVELGDEEVKEDTDEVPSQTYENGEGLPEIKSEIKPIAVVENVDDSQELADEVGISNIFDEYHREVLEPVFENQLRLSKNSIKLAYSKIKNTILSYKKTSQRFFPNCENFYFEKTLVFRMEIGKDCLYLYGAIDSKDIDETVFLHKATENELLPSKVEIYKDSKKLEVSSLEKALKFIEEIVKKYGMVNKNNYVYVAYAERYQHNPQAVLRGKELFAPIDNEFDNEEYDFVENEISRDIIKELMGKDFDVNKEKGQNKLDALRQQANTIKGAIAIAEPIVYFYDCALNNDNSIAYINVQQVLNDKFLGKILPQQYFAVAESSERITKLNMLEIEQVVKDCKTYPDYTFVIKISSRILAKDETLIKLQKIAKTENDNLVMALDCSLLELLGKTGFNAVNTLKQQGIKIMIDDTENASLKVLTEYPIDYLRFDARYYNKDNPATLAHLDMLTGYAKVQGIIATSQYVDTTKQAELFQKHGVEVIQGFAVNKPQRVLNSAKKRIKLLKPFKK